METSQVLFKRLANKGAIQDSSRCSLLTEKNRGGSARTMHTDRKAPNFQQWVRAKDAEKRLKKKLIQEEKREIRQELLQYAKNEKYMHDSRVNQMEQWLIKKKLNEAYKVSQLRDSQTQQEIEAEALQQMKHGYDPKNYKMWLTQRRNQAKYSQMERAMMVQLQ